MFKKRSEELELMDDLLLAEEALRRNLDELEVINQRLGGYKVVTNALETLLPELQKLNRKITIADLGCGGGDTLREMASWCLGNNLPVALKGIDANNFMLQYATLKCVGYPEISFQQQNIFSEEFARQRYDIIVCSLFCHHFSDADLVTFFQQFASQVRTAVIINDLHRHPVAYYSIKALTNLFSGSYLVKNDAPLSVLRAFRKKELQNLLLAAGITNYALRWKWAFRWQLVLFPG
jgi:2-polyprenyl-3-methyl-5-hydroxy-6-metoxy-1,4-benzoquinol methylase